VSKREAIRNFLIAKTHPDLAGLYNPNMEVQVNVGQDGGEPVDGEFNGRRWTGWTDGFQTWKPFRIPWRAHTEPHYDDSPMNFDLGTHAEGIGLTGWDWQNRVSRWVGFDFDGIAGHAEGHRGKLTDEELAEVKKKATEIPWVTVRKSTSGTGIHLYVFLPGEPTATHTEHAALARAVLDKMGALVGFDFNAKVDACGGNMWVWHRKMRGTDGLTLVKQGETLTDLPPDWRNHAPVAPGEWRRAGPQLVVTEDKRSDCDRLFDELTRRVVPLDAEHHRLLDWLSEQQAPATWDAYKHMLVTHTYWLKQAQKALGLRGPFETVSTGRNKTTDINCFAFPLRGGAWVVRRYTTGVAEAATWGKDKGGRTCCYLNRDPGRHKPSKGHGASGRRGFSFTIPLPPSNAPTGGH
jgi:hypothetical protein